MRKLMSTTVAVVALALATSAQADAKPRRVVVLEFDGKPRQLAESGRSSVMALLGDQYDVVATKRWDSARAQATGHGPKQWQQAAKTAGVDAVIEGWVQEEGRHHVLTVAVREAATGNEIDSVSVRVSKDGVQAEATRKLAVELDEVFEWIDGDATASTVAANLPDVRELDRERVQRARDEREARDFDEVDDDRFDERPLRKPRKHRRRPRIEQPVDDDLPADEAPAPKAAEPAPAPAPKQVAVSDPVLKDTSDLVRLFGPETREAADVSDGATQHRPRPTPRFAVQAGGYLFSRGMTFDYDPNAKDGPPTYPGQNIKGLSVAASVYPMPSKKIDGELQGIGFTLGLEHSVGSIISAQDESGYGDYTMEHATYNAGIHYRYPIDIVTFDGEASYGHEAHRIIDLPESIEIPDTDTTYFAAGGHIELAVTDKARVGVGGRYLYILGTGDISDQDWYGAGTAWGLALDGNFTIPLPQNLFLRGAFEYRRVTVEFEGSGVLADKWGVWTSVDSSIGATAQVGVQF